MAGQKLLLVLIILISTCIFALCWAFMIIVWDQEYVILPDHVVDLITRYPTVLTLISTVISTILSVTTTALLSFAVKKAINHYITRPISLVELHTAIALTKPQPLLRWNHYKLSFFTLIFVCLVALLNSSWTTLLLPIPLLWPVPIEGRELYLISNAFDAKLGLDATKSGKCSRYPRYYGVNERDFSLTFRLLQAEVMVFSPSTVSYITVSTSGILPVVEDYAGTSLHPGGIGLEYYGGKVAVNTSVLEDRGHFGLTRNYTVTQRGLSAIITLHTNSSTTTWWQGTASCPLGTGSGYWSTEENDSIGFLGIIVCPTPVFVNSNVTSFDILLQGMGQYNFLDATVCKSGNDLCRSTSTSVPSSHSNTMSPPSYRSVVSELSSSSQTTYSNPLGQLLRLSRLNTTSSVNETLANYFRGIVEFSATYLRCAYSAEGASTNSTMQDLYSNADAFIPLNGTMYIFTYGWDRKRPTYIYILCVFVFIWTVTVSAAVYSLIQERTHPRTGPIFDASNPVHLMMAASAGGLETLAGFEDNGALANERARVRLLDGRGVAPDDAVGENTSARSTRSTMPRFEIVP
ncbi:hypothetical protein DFJ58DRAFT_747045 [Suillus subalutaceus]|uniref:uncharacterized protein n=1 Tax=Suillus subalutaceus TaxID=48586 RepID=UPI001B85BF4E|nr:uncharacterized protein DFJ58DRAFT_747045 [Suillus subalutaceus]KAG1847334.1 hypothetical protein DFJ58DRAFT_747045 [Suillus subalutaceus]